MRQIVWRDHGTYDVKKLWKLSSKLKTKRLSLNKLKHNLDKDYWTVIDKNKERFVTPNQVIKDPYKSHVHFFKMMEADLSYPIIVYDDNGDLDVLDGLHRLSKAKVEKRKTINVKIINDEILAKAKVKSR